MTAVKDLDPKPVFRFFEEISNIPRGSGNTRGMTEYLAAFARERGLAYRTDEIGNVMILKKAAPGFESRPAVLLQGHVDMVCVKTRDSDHNFETDPIRLILDGDWLHADRTTLGGDDGIAVAYMLALLDSDDISHPALECLFTIDEETGMYGAKALDPAWISARLMINLDSEEEGILTTGCAGGLDVESLLPIDRSSLRGIPVRITISGLVGGHSGGEIHKPVASANKLMGRLLKKVHDELPVSLVDLAGGDKRNAIATSCEATLLCDEEDLEPIHEILKHMEADFRNEYKGMDDSITIGMECEEPALISAMDEESTKRIISFLILVPHGVEKMIASIPGAVETSTNLGIIESQDDTFHGWSLVRSAVGSSKNMLSERIVTLTELLGGCAELGGDYPAWEFKPESDLLTLVSDVYKEKTGKEAIVSVTHGGLECGLLSDAIPDLEIVSMGPDMSAIHTAAEKLSVSSVRRTWDVLLAILAKL